MADTLETLNEIREINASFPYTNPVREWKEQGKKVIGWSCIYVPEEIIYAAGALPIRVTGDSRELDLKNANAYLFTSTCSFMRSCFELAYTGQFDFLDGYVPCAVCEGIIRLAEAWDFYIKKPVIYMLDIPRKLAERGYEYYLTEVVEFKQWLERFLNVQISEPALIEAIGVYNKTRELLKRLYDLRKENNPPISGAETLEVLNAAVRMPREQYNLLLEKLLEEIEQTERTLPGEIRLMLSGSILNNAEFIRGIEELGAVVVIDDLCTGARYFWDRVSIESNPDPLEALCRRYFNVFPCARANPPSVRIDRVVELAKEFRVDGVITEMVKSCPGVIYDQVLLREKLEENGIPVYEVDIDYGTLLTGQLRTRVEAFLETIGLLP